MSGPSGVGAFSVGLSGGVVVVVVVVVVVLDSSGVPLSVLHPAVKPIIAMAAPRPTPAAIRRRRTDAISGPLLVSTGKLRSRLTNASVQGSYSELCGPCSETRGGRSRDLVSRAYGNPRGMSRGHATRGQLV